MRDSKKEALARALKERRAGIRSSENEVCLFEKSKRNSTISFDEYSASSSEDDVHSDSSKPLTKSSRFSVESGSGLKRPLERDSEGRPLIKRRRRDFETSQRHVSFDLVGESEWEGFSSDTENIASTDKEPLSDHITSKVAYGEQKIPGQDGIILSEDNEASAQENISSSTDTEEESNPYSNVDILLDLKTERKRRASAFTAWATQRRNEAIGFVPSGPITADPPQLASMKAIQSFTPRPLEDDPLPPELETYETPSGARKAFSVAIERSPECMAARLALPIVPEEQRIMEAIHNNDVVIISGATGSGKTTQIPQFLFEAGYGNPNSPTPGIIGITQPRRVAAVSMAKRVGEEMGSAKDKVSYQASSMLNWFASIWLIIM